MNKAQLIGNLCTEPELKSTPSGSQVLSINLATNERWKDRDGNRQEKAEFHRLVVWDKLAEIIHTYCHKGSKLYVEGRIQTRKWTDQSGAERYTTEIVVQNMEMLDGRKDDGDTPAPRRERAAKPSDDTPSYIPGDEEELPF